MTVDKITFGDILRSAEIDDLDAALLRLQQIAGIDGGDSVATVFSGGEAEAWPSCGASTGCSRLDRVC